MTVLSHPPPAHIIPVSYAGDSSPIINHGYRTALGRLGNAYTHAQPLAILIGEGKAGASYLIDRFLAGIGGDVTVVRLTEPCPDAIDAMRGVVHAIGFETDDLTLNDLRSVLTMFLSHQKRHDRRAVICLEQAQQNGRRVLDELFRLVKLETERGFGLMVIMSGDSALNAMLDEPSRQTPGARAALRISLTSFSLAETREYVRWCIESAGTAKIADVFEFNAITLIHELCDGAPDAVRALCCQCVQLAEQEASSPVTAELVRKANERREPPPQPKRPDAESRPAKVNGASRKTGRLVARMDGEVVLEKDRDGGHILIGRDKLCDIQLASRAVSRHHALLVNAPDSVNILDIGSTNGTFVDGRQMRQYTLKEGGEITLGDYMIQYVASDDGQTITFDFERRQSLWPRSVGPGTLKIRTLRQGNGAGGDDNEAAVCLIKGNISRTGEKIYHLPGTAFYDATRIDESKGERWFGSEQEARAAGWRPPKP